MVLKQTVSSFHSIWFWCGFSNLSLEELKACVAELGGMYCDIIVDDNICLISGWIRNPNGNLRGLNE